MGGPEVSYESELFLKENPGAAGVMTGEGEETFRELCAYYLKQGNDSAGSGTRQGSGAAGSWMYLALMATNKIFTAVLRYEC